MGAPAGRGPRVDRFCRRRFGPHPGERAKPQARYAANVSSSPDKGRKTVIRGGPGVFYDRTGANPLADLVLYQDGLKSYLLLNPRFPAPLFPGDVLTNHPADAVQFAPGLREPYSIQYSLGVERQLAKRTTLAVTYSGSRCHRYGR